MIEMPWPFGRVTSFAIAGAAKSARTIVPRMAILAAGFIGASSVSNPPPGLAVRPSRFTGPLAPAGSARRLLELHRPAGLLEVGLQLVGLVALDALLDGLRRLVHQRLRLLEAEAGGGADDLDHLDLLVAGAREDDVDGRRPLVLAGRAVARGRRGGRGSRDRGRGHSELLLERLDALSELEHGDALQLVDPLLRRRHLALLFFALGGRGFL